LRASAAQVRSRKSNCGGIGRSTQRVPSLSNVAIRSAAGTNPGPAPATRCTNVMIARFAGESFQLANT